MLFWVAGLSLVLSFIGTAVMRRYALATEMLDVPNERSSHSATTPRGGGLAIVAAALGGALSLAAVGGAINRSLLVWVFAAAGVAAVGFADDRVALSARSRLVVHAIAAVLLVAAVGIKRIPWPSGIGLVDPGMLGIVLVAVATIWSINLFNFMDGIDGIAGAQAVFVFCAAATIEYRDIGYDYSEGLLLIFATSAFGFLVWNWPPARIFMGDVGSGFLGFLVPVAALLTSGAGGVSVWTWVVLYGAFIADATTTLTVRALRGDRVFDAHRTHVYQRLARRWNSHGRVVLLYAAVNLFWLFPLGVLTTLDPKYSAWIALLALSPLVIAALALRAGQPDR